MRNQDSDGIHVLVKSPSRHRGRGLREAALMDGAWCAPDTPLRHTSAVHRARSPKFGVEIQPVAGCLLWAARPEAGGRWWAPPSGFKTRRMGATSNATKGLEKWNPSPFFDC